MLISEDKNTGKYVIRSYAAGIITVNDTSYSHSIILSPNELIDHWAPQNIKQLTPNDFEQIIQQNPEVVLIGTGEKQHFPAPIILSLLMEKNIGFEIMDTNAACRTFNLLASEDRRVIAALLIN